MVSLPVVMLILAVGAVEGPSPSTPAGAAETPPTATEAPGIDENAPPPSTYDLQRHKELPLQPNEDSIARQLGRTLFGLVIVVALIFVFLKLLLPRFLKMRQLTGGETLKVLERVQLDTRHSLVLVQVRGEQTLLVGTGEQGVHLIADVSHPEGQQGAS